MNSFGPQADIIIARLKAIDRTHPIIDCPRIEQAVIEHFHALEISTITHEEHRPISLPPGSYRVGQVQEYDHFAEEARQVRD